MPQKLISACEMCLNLYFFIFNRGVNCSLVRNESNGLSHWLFTACVTLSSACSPGVNPQPWIKPRFNRERLFQAIRNHLKPDLICLVLSTQKLASCVTRSVFNSFCWIDLWLMTDFMVTFKPAMAVNCTWVSEHLFGLSDVYELLLCLLLLLCILEVVWMPLLCQFSVGFQDLFLLGRSATTADSWVCLFSINGPLHW